MINETNGFNLINTGTIDRYSFLWGLEELTDKGEHYLTPYLPKDSEIISKNRKILYGSPKIIVAKIALRLEAVYDEAGQYSSINTNCLHSFCENVNPKFLIAWLNSKLYQYMFECFFDGLRMAGGYLLYSSPNLSSTYIKIPDEITQKSFEKHVESMNNLNGIIKEKKLVFLSRITTNFPVDKLSNKLKEFYNHDFRTFLSELKKKKVKLSLKQQEEWEEYFNEYKKEINSLQETISQTDKEIDKMVYELYGLTEEEIKIVEESVR